MKKKIIEIRNIVDGVSSRIDKAEERTGGLDQIEKLSQEENGRRK